MIIFPTTLKEVKTLIDDEIQESLHLDYKEARAVGKTSKQKADFGKDVSAFANSDGGVLVYGIQEKGHLPVAITGIDHSQFTREFIEQTIRTNISQPSPNFTVVQIPVNEKESVYSVNVEKSYGNPHQCKEDKKFYKRFNFESVPMENYEIDDVRNRQKIIPSLINISANTEASSVFLEVENRGSQVATDVSFEIPKELKKWAEENCAKLFTTGIKFFPPQQKYKFWYGVSHSIVHESSKVPNQFEITVSYNHPLYSQRITQSFGIDLLSYYGSYIGNTESSRQVEKIEKAIKELTKQLEKINSSLSEISNIANPSGLNLSVSTLKNLRNILENKSIEKINPIGQNYLFFVELLDIPWRLAYEVADFFRRSNKSEGLDKIKGMDNSIIENIKKIFILDSKEIED